MKTHSQLIVYNAQIVSDDNIVNGAVVVDNGVIADILSKEDSGYELIKDSENNYDAKGHWIIPGLVDIHCHGGNNSSFMDSTVEDYSNILQFFLKNGTTSIFPTSLSCDDRLLVEFLDTYGHYLSSECESTYQSMLKGVHLEGPFLSTQKAGAQSKQYCKSPDISEISIILDKYPFIKRWTIAPEMDDNHKLSDLLISKGVLVSAGHTDVLYDDMCQAIKNGYRHMTHLYSGMNSLVYIDGFRRAGAVEAALLSPDATVEIIADGVHLPYPFIEIVYRLKGSDRIAVITDAMRGTGTDGTTSMLGNRVSGTPVILENGVAMLPDRTSLAGSITTQIDMLRRLRANTDIPFIEIVKMCTYTPARIMDLHDSIGLIQTGYTADLLELDNDLRIVNVIKSGSFV